MYNPADSPEDDMDIPPAIMEIGKDHPEVLVAYINAIGKKIDLKRSKVESRGSGAPSVPPPSNHPPRSSACTVNSESITSNPWHDNVKAEVTVHCIFHHISLSLNALLVTGKDERSVKGLSQLRGC